MSHLTERQISEAAFHDLWADGINLAEIDPDTTFEAPTAIECQYVLSQMGNLRGKRILDLGCGCGESAVYFAKQGAIVNACDISPKFVAITEKLAQAHGVSVEAAVCPSETLPFADHSFDLVFANGVLHHVEIPPTMQEIRRVLKPGGQGFFIEPLPYNPAINAYRIIAREVRTPHERPLHRSDLRKIRGIFPQCHIAYFWFFALGVFLYFFFIERANPNQERYWKKILYQADRYAGLFRVLKGLDDALLPKLPFLKPFCWNMVIAIRAER